MEVVKTAVPPLRMAVPNGLWPSRNVTVPVALGGLTVALMVTA
jgi:hypothetical protein